MTGFHRSVPPARPKTLSSLPLTSSPKPLSFSLGQAMATTVPADAAGNGPTSTPTSDAAPSTETHAPAASDAETATTDKSQPPPPSSGAAAPASTDSTAVPPAEKRWPGWPGDSVFRLIVPVLKVGSIIGRKGELIKKMCEETRARIRILEGAIGTSDRIVLISGKEEPDAEISPAMEAALRVFKRVSGLSEGDGTGAGSASASGTSSIRLLVASSQAINLIGKQGSLIKSIQENTGASVRVLSENEVPFYATTDERIVEIQGDSVKVLKALQAVVGHLRKFLVDHSVIPLFEKTYSAAITQDRAADSWNDKTHSLLHPSAQTGIASDYPLSLKRDSLYLNRETLDTQIQPSGLSLYGEDPSISGLRSSGLGRNASALVTQITQIMQIPLAYAEDIIGVGGSNIGYIRRTSGAILTVQECRGLPDEITVEIKGTSSQVQTAQQLIQEFIASHKEPVSSSYSKIDSSLRSSYSSLSGSSYPSSSLATQSLGGYGSSGVGGYSSYRL